MNILADALPVEVSVDGKLYSVECNFRVCLKTILAFEDDTLTPQEKQGILLSNTYGENVPGNIQEALEKANWFLNGGKESKGEGEASPRLYSFSKDASFIFAAFRQTHGIDLQKTDLHWWEFLALFMDLGSETTFSGLVGLRKRIKNGTATKEERQAAREMGDLFEVSDPDTRTLEEKEQEREFMRLVAEGYKK